MLSLVVHAALTWAAPATAADETCPSVTRWADGFSLDEFVRAHRGFAGPVCTWGGGGLRRPS